MSNDNDSTTSADDTNLDVQALVDKITRLKGMLKLANERSEKPVNIDGKCCATKEIEILSKFYRLTGAIISGWCKVCPYSFHNSPKNCGIEDMYATMKTCSYDSLLFSC